MESNKIKNIVGKVGNTIIERLKHRYIFLLIIVATIFFFSFFYKGIKYRENFKINSTEKQLVLDQEVKQNITMEYNNPLEVCIKVGKNDPVKSTKYNVSLRNGDESVVSVDLDTQKLESEQVISLMLPKMDNIKHKDLTLVIKSDNKDEKNALNIFTNSVDSDGMTINNNAVDSEQYVRVAYPKYEGIYLYALGLLAIACCGLILFIDFKKIHNGIFAIILVIGTFISVLNPVLDSPDEHAHLSRTDLTSRGILSVTEESSYYRVMNSVGDILEDNFLSLEDTKIFDKKLDTTADYKTDNYANANLFVGYIPQAIGITIAKIFGRSSGDVLLFGRIFNLIFYALAVRFAIKIAPIFKIPLSVIAIMPMSLFVAGSFNSDATTYGVSLILIAYFLYLYKKENINIKEIIIYSAICIFLGFVKLPYCVFGGLILFLPKSKFIDNKTYYKTFIFVALVAIISFGRGIFAMTISGASPYAEYYIKNNIDAKMQIMYILHNPVAFIKGFTTALVNNLSGYNLQLTTLGWLSYGINSGVAVLNTAFIGSIILFYPNEEVICKKTRYGIGLVAAGIYMATCLMLYLMWTSVGSDQVLGVQGRYLIPLIALITLLSSGKSEKSTKDSNGIKVIFISIMLLAILIITIMNRYY